MGFTSTFLSSIAANLFSNTDLGLTYNGTEINGAGYSRFRCGTGSTSGSFSTSGANNAFTVTNLAKIRMEEAIGVAGFGSINGIAIFSNGTRIFEASTTTTIVVAYDELPKFNVRSIAVTIS